MRKQIRRVRSTGVVGVSGMAGIVIVAYLALSFVVVHGLLLASAGRGGVTRGCVDRRPVSLDHLAMFHLAVEADELVVVSARDVGGFRGRLHRGRRRVLLLRDVSRIGVVIVAIRCGRCPIMRAPLGPDGSFLNSSGDFGQVMDDFQNSYGCKSEIVVQFALRRA